MIKEVKYGGYSANPNDHEALEGDLAVAMNLIPEDGTVRPVLPPAKVFDIPNRARILCVHKTAAFHHYICLDGTALKWLGKDGTEPPESFIRDFAGAEVIKVEPVGNTLVVLAGDGVHYILWKQVAYHYLGDHIPELDIQFSAFGVQPHIKAQLPNGVYEFELGESDDDRKYQKVIRDKEIRNGICNAAMAALNATFRGIASKKLFMFPFFVRYAFRLYDGSLTMHSAPILIALPNDAPQVKMVWNINNGVITPVTSGDGRERFYGCKVDAVGYVLCKRAVDENQLAALEPWSDIITKVSIFISPQFYTYEMDAKNDDIIIGEETTQVPAAKDRIAKISNNANFYLAAEYDVDKINDASKDKPWSNTARDAYYSAQNLGKLDGYTQVNIDFEPTNDNIVTRTAMTDDYQTHEKLLPTTATSSFAYNSRINLSNMHRKLFNGFSPCCLWFDFDETFSANTTSSGRHGRSTGRAPSQNANPDYSEQSLPCTCTVVVKANDGREIVMVSQQRYMYFYEDKKILWFYYPDENAVRAYFDIDGDKYEINLKKHSMLYGAYFFSLEEDMEQKPVDSIPTPSTDEERVVSVSNKLYTSEINNPFFFPATGINTVGTGEIYGICAAVKALSQGQFGQFPLYAFTSEGVWALHTTDSGGFSAVQPVSRDVCINPESITQLDDAVLFVTARGIMLISGSQTQCVSDAIDDKGHLVPVIGADGFSVPEKLAMLNGMGIMDPVGSFEYFLADCRMVYDYRGQRVIVYNPGYSYAYIYSLQSNKWGMMQSNIGYGIRSYPDALAVTQFGRVVDCSAGDTSAAAYQLLVTRPLALDNPDVLKTVDTVIQRGLFPRWGKGRESHVSQVLLGSRDLYRWHIVQSSGNEYLRGFSGSPYKWFRVALMLRLTPGESVTGCTIQLTPRHDNRPR